MYILIYINTSIFKHQVLKEIINCRLPNVYLNTCSSEAVSFKNIYIFKSLGTKFSSIHEWIFAVRSESLSVCTSIYIYIY